MAKNIQPAILNKAFYLLVQALMGTLQQTGLAVQKGYPSITHTKIIF